jgi:hypothetical protein
MGWTDMGLPEPRPLRRREFLVGTLAAAGTIALGAPPAHAAEVTSSATAALGSERARTYRALVAVLAGSPDGRFRHARPGAATAAFARWYAGQAAPIRHHADAVLDVLGADGPPRYEQLARAVPACRDAAGARWRAAVAAGIELAALVIAPPPPPGERSVNAPLPVPVQP